MLHYFDKNKEIDNFQERTPNSSSATPYVSIPVQYPNNNGLLYLNQNVPWSAHGMDKENYFKPNSLENKSLVPAYQTTNTPDNFWYSNPYEAWNEDPIIVEPTEPKDSNMHQLDTSVPKNIDTEALTSMNPNTNYLDAPFSGSMDTKELSQKLTQEIHNYNICRQNFAKKVLNKGPRVLQQMLKDPKPWKKLQSARVNYMRVYNWLNWPLEKRLRILDMELMGKKAGTSGTPKVDPLNAPLPEYVNLDTKQLAERLIQEMDAHKISRAKFAKNILNTSQMTLSYLLNKPKSWEKIKDRSENYVKIYNWLNLPVEARMEYFKEENENCSRKRPSTSETNELNPKRKCTKLSDSQKEELDKIFEKCANLSPGSSVTISNSLGLKLSEVQDYFQSIKNPNAK
ncbi:hypothetical protein B9Z55_007165 [Caenorhabditis nigoni]|uniref:CUT domain-containing protein n=1 Tax=Caenorhabditis nigoni TaxID=1611254 RepID=A0A2G5V8C8_9PELO|nr:hypothetical protein B9Z55_007165 [Caenorhabditis nigoni]